MIWTVWFIAVVVQIPGASLTTWVLFCDGDDMVCDDNARGDRWWRVEMAVYFLVRTSISRAMAGQ